MKNARERAVLKTFIGQLLSDPTWVQENFAGGAWLDAQRRLNICRVRDYQAGSPLARLTINQGPDLQAGRITPNSPSWMPCNHVQPDWRLELICLEEELEPFAAWLAAVVNRREGARRHLPAPPFALLNWNDPARLEDYLYYVSSISIQSEHAFTNDLRWRRHQPARRADRERLAPLMPGVSSQYPIVSIQ